MPWVLRPTASFVAMRTRLLDVVPAVGFRQGRDGVATDRHGEPGRAECRDERETTCWRGAVAKVERARAVEGHAAVGVLRAARDPAGDGDPLAETDEARAVEL